MLILEYFKSKGEAIALGLLILVAVFVYASFNWGLPQRYNSPDEAANAYFARRLANSQSIKIVSPLNKLTGVSLVHPRSTSVIDGYLVPASFLGLPILAGTVGWLVGGWALPYITPLGAILGLICFYLVGREFWGRRAAWLSTLLLAFLPAYWYYHSRSFFHNALFFDVLMLAIWSTIKAVRTKKCGYYLLTGLAYGVVVALRGSEVFWITTAGLVWLTIAGYKLKWRYLSIFMLGVLLGFAPVLMTNYIIYGQPLSIGYRPELQFILQDVGGSLSIWRDLILPFGIHPSIIFNTVGNYLFSLMWWWAMLAVIGFGYMFYKWRSWGREHRGLILSGLVATLWLVILYGSWQFHDNPNPMAVTLGTAYTRYWLPVYAFALWLASYTLVNFWHKNWGKAISFILIGVYLILSVRLVVFDPEEGLLQIRRNIKRFEAVNKTVQQLTESNSVILTTITDKFFWPEREVMVSSPQQVELVTIKNLLENSIPVYNFHPTWLPKDLNYLNTNKLKQLGLVLQPVVYGFQDHSLYRFTLAKP
jgi:hypothetical protein